MLKEFKEFAMKGNVVDMAVGIIIGAAFGKIVSSLVSDVIMPPIGVLVGGVDFSSLSWTIREVSEGVEIVTLNYGAFINSIIDFIIIALAIFFVIKMMNKLRREEPSAAPMEKECTHCLSKIPIKATKCKCCSSEIQTKNPCFKARILCLWARRESKLTASVQVVDILFVLWTSKYLTNLFDSHLTTTKYKDPNVIHQSLSVLWARRESNPHALRHNILSVACIPFHH
jgi:large conductance mechanosensitive channel